MSESGFLGNIVIVGCGRLGSSLANRLSQAGSRVVIIDRSRSSFSLLEPGFSGFRVTGDAAERNVLVEASIQEADCLIAATEKDTLNLMVAQVARHVFSVPKVLARVYDPKRETVFLDAGIEIVSPTRLMVDTFLAAVRAQQESA